MLLSDDQGGAQRLPFVHHRVAFGWNFRFHSKERQKNAMKITKVEVIPISNPMKHPMRMGGSVITHIHSILLKLTTDEGLVGFSDSGDTSTWYRGETQDSMMALILDYFAPKILLGEDPIKIEKIVGRMDVLARDNNQAKATVDFALHDLVGKIFNQPVYNLLGGRTVDKVAIGYVLGAGNPDEVAQQAVDTVRKGFGFVKVKTSAGEALKNDIAVIAAVREAVGYDVRLFIDPNGFWNYEQALHTMRALDKYNLACVEQPLAAWDIAGMARLRGQIGTPVYADESAQELHQLAEIIRIGAADGFMIKTQKAGGLLKSQRWLTMARLANMSVTCGCMVGSGLEASPAAHLLVSDHWASQFVHENAGPLHIHGVSNSDEIEEDVSLHGPLFKDGFHAPNDGPGLGIELNEPFIKRILTPGKPAHSVS